MERDRLRFLAPLILAMLVVSVAAATIESPSKVDRGTPAGPPTAGDVGTGECLYSCGDTPMSWTENTDDASDGAGSSPPSLGLLAVFGLIFLVGMVALLRGTGSDFDAEEADVAPANSETPDEPPDADEPEPDVAAVARSAGRAADRLDDAADAENEIYRAWLEMTRHLDVDDPETSTPAEFAEAAIAAGMARDDVLELTELFETARYGHHPVTDAREERAVDVLERIETAYGDDGEETP